MKKAKRILALLLLTILMFSVCGISASAANLYWNLNDGVLTISGRGAMPDYSYEVAPWRKNDKNVKKIKSISVDYGVTHIGDQSFQFCSSAKDAYIADSVESIGYAAFYDCSKLKSVRMPMWLDELGESAFDHCSSLEFGIVPNGVEVIEMATFNCCTSMKSVYIPKTVTEIKYAAFWYCTHLEDVYYEGSWTDWDEIEIDSDNSYLKKANFHFNSRLSYS